MRAALESGPTTQMRGGWSVGSRGSRPGDPELSALEALVRDRPLDRQESIVGFFALAKAYEDAGDYQRAFDSLRRANFLQRATFEYDVEGTCVFSTASPHVFNADLFARFAHSGAHSEIPILVVGMPRSEPPWWSKSWRAIHGCMGAESSAIFPTWLGGVVTELGPGSHFPMG